MRNPPAGNPQPGCGALNEWAEQEGEGKYPAQQQQRPRHQLVGELIQLRAGEAAPDNARIIAADGVEVDESSLTGES